MHTYKQIHSTAHNLQYQFCWHNYLDHSSSIELKVINMHISYSNIIKTCTHNLDIEISSFESVSVMGKINTNSYQHVTRILSYVHWPLNTVWCRYTMNCQIDPDPRYLELSIQVLCLITLWDRTSSIAIPSIINQ